MSTADHDAGTGEWARIPLRAWLVADLKRTLRAVEQHLHEHTDTDSARDLLRDLGYYAGLLGWHLHKHRTEPTTTACQECTR